MMQNKVDLADSSLDIDTREFEIMALQHNYWQEMEVTNAITTRQKHVLLEYDQSSLEDRVDLLEERGIELCPLFISIIHHPENVERVDYVLTLMNQILSAHPDQAKVFNDVPNCFDPFFGIIERKSDSKSSYTVAMASRVLAALLAEAASEEKSVGRFVDWIVNKINDVTNGRLDQTNSSQQLIPLLLALKILLKADVDNRSQSPHPQDTFVASGGLDSLIGVLTNKIIAKNAQTLYVCGFCIWLLSFNDKILPAMKNADIVVPLVNTIKTVAREKVVRICFSTFHNLLSKTGAGPEEMKGAEEKEKKKQPEAKAALRHDLSFAEDMVGQQLHKTVERLLQQSWKDPELVRTLEYVHFRLKIVLRKLSSFGMYEVEAMSGALQRGTPVHTEDFWRNNFENFEAGQFKLIRKIIDFLTPVGNSDDTLEMACFDLGEFARFHPDGRRVLQLLKAKPKLMFLMGHSNPAVAKQALLCVQKIMLTNWEALNKSASGGLASLNRSGKSN